MHRHTFFASTIIALLFLSTFFGATPTYAQTSSLAGFQTKVGVTPQYTPNITGGFSPWAQGGDTKAVLGYLSGGTVAGLAGKDMRICIQAEDNAWVLFWVEKQTGPVRCTPWASDGGGWSAFSSSPTPKDPDRFRLKIESRAWPKPSVRLTDVRLGLQAADAPIEGAGCSELGDVKYTPWASAGGGWSPLVHDMPGQVNPGTAFDNDLNCVRLGLNVTTESTAAGPTCTSFTASPSSLTYPGGNTTLSWNVSNATSVSITPGIGTVTATGSRSVPVGTTTTYTLSATNASGKQCQLTRPVTVSPAPVVNPTATLSRCNATTDAAACSSGSSGWTTGNMTIITGHTIKLRWSSTNATTCSGSNFSTGGAAANNSGVTPLTVPTSGNPVTYTLTCNDTNASTPAAISRVTVTANDIAPELTSSESTVRYDDSFTLTWNLNGNDPAGCTITGPGSTLSGAGSLTAQTGNTTINAVGTATYTLECPGGEDSVSIQLLPQEFES